MAERFRLFADNHIRRTIVDGLRRAGWAVEQSIDRFPEGTPDEMDPDLRTFVALWELRIGERGGTMQ